MAQARGTTVVWRMWRGDPAINAYVDGWVAPRMRDQFGVSVQAVESQGPELVNVLATEREALGDRPGTTSLVWINGETFAQLRSERLLDGPWANSLPNASLIDTGSSIVSRDFEQDPAGYESPWGMVQFALIYDSARTLDPPTSIAALAAWIRAHPGRFTHDQQFTGVTFLKGVMYGLAGGVQHFQGGFDEERYRQGRDRLFAWLMSPAAVPLEERRDLSSRRGGHASPLRERRDRFHDVEQPERGRHEDSPEGRSRLNPGRWCSTKARLPMRTTSAFPSTRPTPPARWCSPTSCCPLRHSSRSSAERCGETARSSMSPGSPHLGRPDSKRSRRGRGAAARVPGFARPA